ncbi:hypothetical protein E3N88_06728 [Mikania micrantha]|uniref:Uncharacterized protein n=1 Tax=Mikania micrantha TaxID=192012 RepID=A0A5N6PQL0_9ASTR|nr:hypothetical protein E3N88_06728 [Mikania micrantha]
MEINDDELKDEQRVIDSIIDTAPPPSSSTARIHKVPGTMRDTEDYDKYYVPKVVSIGPYHFGNQKLELIEKIKPIFAMRLLLNNIETLRSLYKKLGEPETVQELRNSYEDNSTIAYCDNEFTKMMLLDGCFILYYILFIFRGEPETCQDLLKSHQIVFVHQDLFLLENQIPFKVLMEVMKFLKIDCLSKITSFIYGNTLASGTSKPTWFESILCTRNNQSCPEESKRVLMDTDPDHILYLLHRSLTNKAQVLRKDWSTRNDYWYTFPNANDLLDVGIHFKPSEIKSLAHIEFSKSTWWFSASVKLPPIIVDYSTKPLLLNLIAYEMWSHEAYDAGVTSYVCFLDSLIDHPEDVKVLIKAGVLKNCLGSNSEVAEVFNEIGTDLVSNNLAYFEAKRRIQKHYESWSNTLYSQLKHEYNKSSWVLALLGALVALILSGVQAFFTVWGPKCECDDLCKFLKMNHHL